MDKTMLTDNKHYKSVDLVKGIAMIMIILVHYGQNFDIEIAKVCQYMQMGCPIFFVASGFGIMCLINSRYKGNLNKTHTKQFYLSRFKALAPGWYMAFFIIYLTNIVVQNIFGISLSLGANRDVLSIICNLFFLNGLLPFCNNNVMTGGWYIGTTVILYALTPPIFKALNGTSKKMFFFMVSSIMGMVVWLFLFLFFRDSFMHNGFGYFLFIVHYPEYLLGMILYYNLSNHIFDAKKIKMYLMLGLASFGLAIILFYFRFPFHSFLSAWMTALATYFVLYYLLFSENTRDLQFPDLVCGFGRNSYYIFLLHAFFAYPFVNLLLRIFEKINIYQTVSFFVLIPFSLVLSYIAGGGLRLLVREITAKFFTNNKHFELSQ